MRQQPRTSLKERRRKQRTIKYSIIAAIIVVCAGLCAYLVRLPAITIAKVEVEGTVRTDAEAVRSAAEARLGGSYAWVVPKRMSLAAPLAAIQASILKDFPEVASASVTRDNLRTVRITVVEREQRARWCNSDCFALDQNGFIYAASAETGGRIYRGAVEGGPIGATFLPEQYAAFAAFLEEVETATRKPIAEVAITADGDVLASFLGGGELRYTLKQQGEELLQSLSSVFLSGEFESEGTFEYADFRFDNKAVVKFSK
ncbi:MAG: FtsQ-type POTRA domain-containing protein [Patescibacteria group bacterium]